MLQVSNLGKRYAGQGPWAVHGLSFSIRPGELVGFIGPNGAGKTTTMRLISGFLAPTTGSIHIGGYPLATQRLTALSRLGYLAEQSALFDQLTPHAYLTFLAQAYGVADVPGAMATATNLTRATGYLHQPMHTLSKGQRQRIFVAGAILQNPPLLVLDEPTDGLDPNQKHELRLVLKELAQRGTAILLSTHILEEAQAICSRVLIVHEGKIKVDTTPAELAKQGKGDIALAFRVLTQNRGKGQ